MLKHSEQEERGHGQNGYKYFAGGLFGSLGQERHTVPKAELQALYKALQYVYRELPQEAHAGLNVVMYSDCSYIVQRLQRTTLEEKQS